MAPVESWLDLGVLKAQGEEAGYRRVDATLMLLAGGCQRHKCEEIQDLARFATWCSQEPMISSLPSHSTNSKP